MEKLKHTHTHKLSIPVYIYWIQIHTYVVLFSHQFFFSVRGYEGAKLSNNIECEIFQVLLEEAKESYSEDIVKALKSDNIDDITRNVSSLTDWIRSWPPTSWTLAIFRNLPSAYALLHHAKEALVSALIGYVSIRYRFKSLLLLKFSLNTKSVNCGSFGYFRGLISGSGFELCEIVIFNLSIFVNGVCNW